MIDVGGKIMKKFVSIILAAFIACSLFAKAPKWDYDKILEIEPSIDFIEDDKLTEYAEYVWKRYFPEYYAKYGVPFVCVYYQMDCTEPFVYSHRYVYDENDVVYQGSLIILHDKDIMEWVRDDNFSYGHNFLAYEMCHIVTFLEMSKEQLEVHASPLNSVFLREVERLEDYYDLPIPLFDHLKRFFPNPVD